MSIPDEDVVEPVTFSITKPAIIEASLECWSCHQIIPVVTIAGREQDGDLQTVPGVFAFDERLSEILVAHPYYKRTLIHKTQELLFVNVCRNCGEIQGDFYLHFEADSPFFAINDPENEHPLKITDIAGPVEVTASCEPYMPLDY